MEIVKNSSIFIVNSIEDSLNKFLAVYPTHQTRVIKNEEKDEFQIEQANKTLKEAYIASNETKYLFLCGATFRVEAQNALLKILEENKDDKDLQISQKIEFLKKVNDELSRNIFFEKHEIKTILEEFSKMEYK